MSVAPFRSDQVLLKPSDIAKRLRVDRTTVYRWMDRGELPFIEIAGTRRVLAAAFDRFAERRKKGVSLEEQAARYIGEGVEVEGEVDLRAGLPGAAKGPAPARKGRTPDPLEDLRLRLRRIRLRH